MIIPPTAGDYGTVIILPSPLRRPRPASRFGATAAKSIGYAVRRNFAPKWREVTTNDNAWCPLHRTTTSGGFGFCSGRQDGALHLTRGSSGLQSP